MMIMSDDDNGLVDMVTDATATIDEDRYLHLYMTMMMMMMVMMRVNTECSHKVISIRFIDYNFSTSNDSSSTERDLRLS